MKIRVLLALSSVAIIGASFTNIASSDALTSSTAKKIVTVLPKPNTTVSGQTVLVSDGGNFADKSFKPEYVGFKIDNGPVLKATNSNWIGYVYYLNTLKLTNGTHKIVSVAKKPNADILYVEATPISFTVKNASAPKPTTSTTKKTSPTVPPTTPTTQPAGDKWVDHTGVVALLTRDNIDKTASLGIKWMKISIEMPSSTSQVPDLIDYAHENDVKILETCQIKGNSKGHVYSGTDSEIDEFSDFCASFVDMGADAIEIGNEWNNHNPFWTVNLDPTYRMQAKYTDSATAAIRAKSSTIPVLSSGYSPEGNPKLANDVPQKALNNMLSKSTTFKAKGTAIGAHAYAFNCDTPLKCGYPEHPEWNAFLSMQDMQKVSNSQGGKHKGIWITEIGAPSGDGTERSDWGGLDKGPLFTTATQKKMFSDYMAGIDWMNGGNTADIKMVFWCYLVDGELATNNVENSFGLLRTNGTRKPATDAIIARLNQHWYGH